MTEKAVSVFFSYAHEDERLRDSLAKHLRILERQGIIKSWSDRCILPGQEWDGQINENLEAADIILLLISADFLASDYCWETEVKRAMEKHESGKAIVIPIILRSCIWISAPFGKLKPLPRDAKPINSFEDLDSILTKIAEEIRRIVREVQSLKEDFTKQNNNNQSSKTQARYRQNSDIPESTVQNNRIKEVKYKKQIHRISGVDLGCSKPIYSHIPGYYIDCKIKSSNQEVNFRLKPGEQKFTELAADVEYHISCRFGWAVRFSYFQPVTTKLILRKNEVKKLLFELPPGTPIGYAKMTYNFFSEEGTNLFGKLTILD